MLTIGTQIDIIKSRNPDFGAVKITETIYLSSLNNHKCESICLD